MKIVLKTALFPSLCVCAVFSRDELLEALLPILDLVYKQEPEACPFWEPVNPAQLGIPVSLLPFLLFFFTSFLFHFVLFLLLELSVGDNVSLSLPSQDYFDIIKNPMDLRTIRNKLEEGHYSNPWDVSSPIIHAT